MQGRCLKACSQPCFRLTKAMAVGAAPVGQVASLQAAQPTATAPAHTRAHVPACPASPAPTQITPSPSNLIQPNPPPPPSQLRPVGRRVLLLRPSSPALRALPALLASPIAALRTSALCLALRITLCLGALGTCAWPRACVRVCVCLPALHPVPRTGTRTMAMQAGRDGGAASLRPAPSHTQARQQLLLPTAPTAAAPAGTHGGSSGGPHPLQPAAPRAPGAAWASSCC